MFQLCNYQKSPRFGVVESTPVFQNHEKLNIKFSRHAVEGISGAFLPPALHAFRHKKGSAERTQFNKPPTPPKKKEKKGMLPIVRRWYQECNVGSLLCPTQFFLRGATTTVQSQRSRRLFLPIRPFSPPYPRRHHSSIFEDRSSSLFLPAGMGSFLQGPKIGGRAGRERRDTPAALLYTE